MWAQPDNYNSIFIENKFHHINIWIHANIQLKEAEKRKCENLKHCQKLEQGGFSILGREEGVGVKHWQLLMFNQNLLWWAAIRSGPGCKCGLPTEVVQAT